jgi:hypothetical protein
VAAWRSSIECAQSGTWSTRVSFRNDSRGPNILLYPVPNAEVHPEEVVVRILPQFARPQVVLNTETGIPPLFYISDGRLQASNRPERQVWIVELSPRDWIYLHLHPSIWPVIPYDTSGRTFTRYSIHAPSAVLSPLSRVKLDHPSARFIMSLRLWVHPPPWFAGLGGGHSFQEYPRSEYRLPDPPRPLARLVAYARHDSRHAPNPALDSLIWLIISAGLTAS